MFGRRVLVAATAVVSLMGLSSCGGSDDDAAGPAGRSTEQQSSSTTDPSTTTPASSDDPEAEEGGSVEDCLQGEWLMGNDATATLFGSLLPAFPVQADGTMTMTFTGPNVEQYINMVVTFTLPEGSVSGPFDQRLAGTYQVERDELAITNDTIEGGWGNLQGTLGGVSVDVPVPPAELPPFTGGPVTCDGYVLTVEYTSGIGAALAVFTRA